MLINGSRAIMFSVAPNFPMVAGIRAGYNLLRSGQTQQVLNALSFGPGNEHSKVLKRNQAQDRVQYVVKLFLEKLTSHSIWDRANDAGILRLPLYEEEDWNSLPFVTQILPVWTRP